MHIRFVPEVSVRVLADGALVLRLGTARELTYDPVGAAMWIALRRHEGDPRRAARRLAGAWEAQPEDVHAEMQEWITVWCRAGFLAQ